MVHSTELSVLKTKDGRFVTIRMSEGTLKLCAVEVQNEEQDAPLVHIKTRANTQMALRFKYGNDYYLPKVDGTSLKLEKAASSNIPEKISESCWFKKANSGSNEHYCLQSVTHPNIFLFVSTQHHIFILSDKRVLFKDENVK